MGIESFQRWQRDPAKRNEIFNLDQHPVPDNGGLGKIPGQRLSGFAVSAVDRRDGVQGEIHGITIY
jgi:hypothetical protein